ncbi:hypothetical protein [Collimonas silvisoli]|uniref:hypothetical protein n=1 Tax=Collimonas silvisoli TaxID=2825884 RepID=UPI001B8B2BDF|nr:hypothetical protein [Collimonas silvisoli]
MHTHANKAAEPWLAGTADPQDKSGPLTSADRLASMEKSLAAFMQALAHDDEETGAPHLMNQHRGCPCCTERGE